MTLSTPPSLKLRHLWPVADRVEYARRRQPVARAERPPLGEWLRRTSPALDWSPPHLQYSQRELEKVARGETKRLMVFWPPRHGKTQFVTVRFPVYMLAHNPAMRIIVGAYNQTLANKFSRMARRVAESAGVALAHDRQAVEEWETSAGGGFRAVGVGGGITGQGGDLILIDDPVKSREEAESLAFRERVWEWYTDDLYTRLEPGAPIVLIMTRWHKDDLAGRILASDDKHNWRVISLPAFAEGIDPLGRAEGEPLWAARFDREALEDRRRVLGAYAFAALYQQRPTPREGGYFKREWWDGNRYDAMDRTLAAIPVGRWIFWDTALSEKDGAAYSAAMVVDMLPDYRAVVREVWRKRLAFPDLITEITDLAKRYNVDGKLKGLVIEDKSSGTSAIQTIASSGEKWLRKLLVPFMPTGSKESRAGQAAVWVENGSLLLPEPSPAVPWLLDYEEEIFLFPQSAQRDQVDITSMGVLYLEPYLAAGLKKRHRAHRQEAA